MNSLAGQLLVASPDQGDQMFAETVVLLITHDAGGAYGLMLNRPIGKAVGEICEEFSEKPPGHLDRLHAGGPVYAPLVALHDSASSIGVRVATGIHFTRHRANLSQLFRADCRFRLYLGCVRWRAGELESEIAKGEWLIRRATPAEVFADSPDLWHDAISATGHSYLSEVLGLQVMGDPSLN